MYYYTESIYSTIRQSHRENIGCSHKCRPVLFTVYTHMDMFKPAKDFAHSYDFLISGNYYNIILTDANTLK